MKIKLQKRKEAKPTRKQLQRRAMIELAEEWERLLVELAITRDRYRKLWLDYHSEEVA